MKLFGTTSTGTEVLITRVPDRVIVSLHQQGTHASQFNPIGHVTPQGFVPTSQTNLTAGVLRLITQIVVEEQQ